MGKFFVCCDKILKIFSRVHMNDRTINFCAVEKLKYFKNEFLRFFIQRFIKLRQTTLYIN